MRLIATNAGEISLSSSLPAKLKSLQVRESIAYGAEGAFGHVLLQELEGDGISMQYSHLQFTENDKIQYDLDQPSLCLHISLSNTFLYEVDGLGTGFLHERGLNLNYVPSMHARVKVECERLYRHLTIFYKPEHLSPLQESFPGLDLFLKNTEAGKAGQFNTTYCIADHPIMLLIDTILKCPYTGTLRKIYLEHIAMDILVLALVQIRESGIKAITPLSEEEIAPIYRAKEILLRDIEKPFSLTDLAEETGLSPYKLNGGFKSVFAMGVTEFLLEQRMERAHLLLQEKDMLVSTVAKKSGYSHPNAFSLAFKKYFGYTPGFVQKNSRSSGNESNPE